MSEARLLRWARLENGDSLFLTEKGGRYQVIAISEGKAIESLWWNEKERAVESFNSMADEKE